MSFSINCLEITAPKSRLENVGHLYKNLLTEDDYTTFKKEAFPNESFKKRFFFNNFYQHTQHGELTINESFGSKIPDNFFSKGINIQAIVGKNGSGKSTLLDLMYMAINNFSFMFERGIDRPGADPLYFIPNLNVNLYFSITGSKKHDGIFKLECQDESIDLIKVQTIDSSTSQGSLKKNSESESEEKSIIKKIYDNKFDLRNNSISNNDQKIVELIRYFFYSIVSNYSIQSFISNNYKGTYKKTEKKQITTVSDCAWIDSIFHKNDGYIRSIVLNPYRNEGCIDCAKEQVLSKDRLTSLFIFSDQLNKEESERIEFFAPYSFKDLEIKESKGFICKKLKSVLAKYTSSKEDEIDNYCKSLPNEECFFEIIEESLIQNIFSIFEIAPKSFHSTKIGISYLIIKLIDIINKYTSYFDYRDTLILQFQENDSLRLIINKKKILSLLDKIHNDPSHITKKIRRTVNFLKINNDIFNDESATISWYHYAFFIRSAYVEWLERLVIRNNSTTTLSRNPFMDLYSKNIKFNSPIDIDDCLPPSFLNYELILFKAIEKKFTKPNEITFQEINYRHLSSGESQLLQTLSIHCYHIENLLSIPGNKERPRYFCTNLIFDEIEICFHPEYQRTFIKRLLQMLEAMRDHYHPNEGGIFMNVTIVTHSPFILSDIPSCNILYLKEGSQDEKTTFPFAGNIGEMVYDSFFMKKTIGEFAESKIKKLIQNRKDLSSEMTQDEAKFILENIGDSIIKSLIKEI